MTRKPPARPTPLEQHVTINEIATRFNLSHWTVRDWIRDGKLAAVKVGNGPRAPLRIRVADVEALLNPVTPSGRRVGASVREADDPTNEGVHTDDTPELTIPTVPPGSTAGSPSGALR